MARVAKPTKATKPAAGKREAGRPATRPAKAAPAAARAAKPTKAAPAPKRASATASAPAPKLNVAELRAHVEKLERSLATLRTKNREAGRAAKTDAARIAELEGQVGRLEAKAASPAPAIKRGPKPAPDPAPATRAKRQSRSPKPADTAQLGAKPGSPELEAEATRESPEQLEGE